jgi:drug/metabolite transporter (DMT)-like permease
MVYPVGVAAAMALGIGYVLQQRVAVTMPMSAMLTWRLLGDLMRRRRWWVGIGFMITGELLAGLALQLGTVAVVEPLLSASLLFALGCAAIFAGRRPTWQEITGAALLSTALAVFIAVGDPHSSPVPSTSGIAIVVAVSAVVGAVGALVLCARRLALIGESVLLATAAGLLYGLQDAATRAALVRIDHHGLRTIPVNPWVYIVVAAAAVGILLSQSAFKAARLDYSLPPIAAAEPIAGVVLGLSLLGDVLSVSTLGLAVEPLCLVAMIAGAALIGRSPSLGHGGWTQRVTGVPDQAT